MQIIKYRQIKTTNSYYILLEHENKPGHGYHIDCDKQGLIIQGQQEWYNQIILTHKLINRGIQKREHVDIEPAIGTCTCGNKVCLSSFTNDCKCGRQYDTSGMELI